jgi:hypothetical protein
MLGLFEDVLFLVPCFLLDLGVNVDVGVDVMQM